MNSGRLYEHPNRSQSGFEDNIRMSQNKINKSSRNFMVDESRNHDISRHSDDALSAHNVNANASNSKIIIETETHSSITASEISDAIPETETMREQHELDG